jgi:transcriptional regulator with GAF, ATPase, and Fis domain
LSLSPRATPVESERDRIIRVLAEHGGNQTRAAAALGMARSTLVLRLDSYHIVRPRKP